MKYPAIAKLVLSKGVDNVTVPENIRFLAMSEAGLLLFKERQYEESGKAFAKAGDKESLIEAADFLSKQGQWKSASYFIIHSGDQKKIEACALECMQQEHYLEARNLFQKVGNENMLTFLSSNFDA
jgi:hypothetical protein